MLWLIHSLLGSWLVLATFVSSFSAPETLIRPTTVDEEILRAKRSRILAIARDYARLMWKASPQNVCHGTDQDGVKVSTPDRSKFSGGFHPDGRVNTGMPYMWGGFSSIESFREGVEQGKLAGHIPSSRAAPASRHAVGVDCSGLVSQCWELPRKQSTRSLGDLCYRLQSYDELLPGDILNTFDGHVLIFEAWEDGERTRVKGIESITPKVSETVRTRKDLLARGFVPLRYRPLDPRWSKDSLAMEEGNTVESLGEFRSSEEALIDAEWLKELASPWSESELGDWIRFRVVNTDSLASEDPPEIVTSARGLVRAEEGKSLLHLRTEIEGRRMDQTEWVENDSTLLTETLSSLTPLALLRFDVQRCEVKEGEITLNGDSIPAIAFSAKVNAIYDRGRGAEFPLEVEFEATMCEEIPVDGIVRSRIRIETESGQVVEGKRTLVEWKRGD